MARRAEPDFVSGVKGRYEISPWISHPPKCVCEICPRHRRTPEAWLEPIEIRARRKSLYPDSRIDSAAYARQFKREEEARLKAAVVAAEARKAAMGSAVPFGKVCDAYREHMQTEGKRYDRDRYRIDAAEKFFGKSRDTATIDRDAYEEFKASLSAGGASASTIVRYTTTLVAMMNHAVRERIIGEHKLVLLRRPRSKRKTKPVTFSRRQVGILLGRAMAEYEREIATAARAWQEQSADRKGSSAVELKQQWYQRYKARKAGKDVSERVSTEPSSIPLRGFCLIAYLTLMRPDNNMSWSWSEITLHPEKDEGRYRLDEHKNSSKGVEVEAALHPILVRYLRQIHPGRGAKGFVHPNPETGEPFTNIRRQWKRLITIANRMLPTDEQLAGKRAQFYTWRHTGASELAASGADPVMIVRMMGDTSLKTVMDHYFDSSVEHMQEIVTKWCPPIGESAQDHSGEAEWTN